MDHARVSSSHRADAAGTDASLARIRAAAAAARTPAALDALLDVVHAYGYAHPEHADASADVAESVFAARQALEQVAPQPKRRRGL